MTPEQEDAHWALVGKPLMRAWQERCRVRREAKHEWQEAGSSNAATAAYARASMASDKWYAAVQAYYGRDCNMDWVASGCVVSGIEYSYSEVNYD